MLDEARQQCSEALAAIINSKQSRSNNASISRGEVRAWIDDDSKPDAARAVDVARELGWGADEWTDTVRALATLVIGIYTFGSIIERNYSPSWSPADSESEAVIERALEQIGVGYRHVTRDSQNQGDEIKPASHATRVGRALVVAGAPVGDKNAESVGGLPEWVTDAPMVVKTDLALLVARGRGSKRKGKAPLAIQADRPKHYFEDVAALIEVVTGATANASDAGVTISADAVRELGLAKVNQ